MMTADEYRALNPSYDPGVYLQDMDAQTARDFLGVDTKRAMLAQRCREHGKNPAGADLLDIGCGMGSYLLAAQDLGMRALGFEPSQSHSLTARQVWNLPVIGDYFTADKVGERRFDIAILSHVIEHIYEPRPFIDKILSVLKPDGILIVITPNAGSVVSRVVGAGWPMLRPVDHVTLLARKGFDHIVDQRHSVRTTTSEYRYEFAATLASIAKHWLRPLRSSPEGAETAPGLIREPSLRSKAVRLLLSIVSWPFYALATSTDNAACLTAVIQKSGKD